MLYTIKIESDKIQYVPRNHLFRFLLLLKGPTEQTTISFREIQDFKLSTHWVGLFLSITIDRSASKHRDSGHETVRLWLAYKPGFVNYLFKVISEKSIVKPGYIRN